MAFERRPKWCQDGPATFQQLNALGANLESLKTDLGLEHSPLDEGSGPSIGITLGNPNFTPPTSIDGQFDVGATPGVHESPLIARGAAYVAQYIGAGGVVSVQLYSAWGSVQTMQVLGTGVYFFPVSGFGKLWGKATPWGNAVTPALDARVSPGSGAGVSGLAVRTSMQQLNGDGELELLPYHTGFHLLCFGRR
ncbi:MAG: hypothetical protein IPJ65_07235 [Archangiaceae bacterium]|nr:hypothetical protein [Archangiaceae bacterium]